MNVETFLISLLVGAVVSFVVTQLLLKYWRY